MSARVDECPRIGAASSPPISFDRDWRSVRAWGIIQVVAKPALDLTQLTPEEKLDLIDELWQSLNDVALSAELRAELDRRLDRLDREGPHGVPWDQVRAQMTRG
jgi:putative addiction module component (TIGR02574 family)